MFRPHRAQLHGRLPVAPGAERQVGMVEHRGQPASGHPDRDRVVPKPRLAAQHRAAPQRQRLLVPGQCRAPVTVPGGGLSPPHQAVEAGQVQRVVGDEQPVADGGMHQLRPVPVRATEGAAEAC